MPEFKYSEYSRHFSTVCSMCVEKCHFIFVPQHSVFFSDDFKITFKQSLYHKSELLIFLFLYFSVAD